MRWVSDMSSLGGLRPRSYDKTGLRPDSVLVLVLVLQLLVFVLVLSYTFGLASNIISRQDVVWHDNAEM